MTVPQSFHQLGILVLDGSGSMVTEKSDGRITKAEAVNVATRELLTRLIDTAVTIIQIFTFVANHQS